MAEVVAPGFAAMRAGLIARGLLDADFNLTDAGNEHAAALVAKLSEGQPCLKQWRIQPTNIPHGTMSAKPVQAPTTGSAGERQRGIAQSAGSTSHSSIVPPSDTGPTTSPTIAAMKPQSAGSTGTSPSNGATLQQSKLFTKPEKRPPQPKTSSANLNGKSGMDIRTTRDLRKFLADVMVDVRKETVTPTQAMAIAKLSAQINQSIAIEVNAALRQGAEGGTYLDAQPMRLADDSPPEGMVWCDQCDARVSVEDARGCKSPHCKAPI